MNFKDFSHVEIIQYAVNMEQRGIKMYTLAAEKVDKEAARNILLFLAEQEKEHEQKFRSLLDSINNDKAVIPKDINDEAVGYIRVLTDNDIFPDDDKEFISKLNNLSEVIKAGKKAEKDSILFYSELSRFGWDKDTKNILKSVLEEEKKHLVQLTDLGKLIEERDIYY